MEYVEVARFDSLTAFQGGSEALDSQFSDGDKALVAILLKLDAAGWVYLLKKADEIAGVHLYDRVFSKGNTLYIPVRKQSPFLAAFAGLLGTIGTLIALGLLAIVIFKVIGDLVSSIADNWQVIALAAIALIVLPPLLRGDGGGGSYPQRFIPGYYRG